MSPRRRSVATLDRPTNDVPESPPVTPTEALKRRAEERFQRAVATYREAVFSAASSDGRLTDDRLDAVVEACQVAGVPVEQFGDDVETVRQHGHQRDDVSRMESQRDEMFSESVRLTKEIERLEVELKEKKMRHRSVGEGFNQRLGGAMRELNDMETRNPHLFLDAARITPDVIRKKLTTRAFFSR
jgi:hypothetical protein